MSDEGANGELLTAAERWARRPRLDNAGNACPDRCRPDSTGADWFRCSSGTVGCPIIHGEIEPVCIACTDGLPWHFNHRAAA